jgi:hypothetical protein
VDKYDAAIFTTGSSVSWIPVILHSFILSFCSVHSAETIFDQESKGNS